MLDIIHESNFEAEFEGYHFFTRKDIHIDDDKTKNINWMWVTNLLTPTQIFLKDG